MIFPLTHENMEARRLPAVTLSIIAICFVVHSLVAATQRSQIAKVEQVLTEAIVYHEAHPYLKLHEPLEQILGEVRPRRPIGEKPAKESPANELERDDEQRHLDGLGTQFTQLLNQFPSRRFGYVAARGDILGLITHQFLHGGWLHLIFNLWFLWLCGCNMEDRWGRAVFGGFYLIAGVVAAFTYGLFTAHPHIPLIGASGAIAGAMGAFLIAFAKTRIRFVTFFRFRPLFFTAPAYVMLPLWLLTQILSWMLPANGVAYGAHVGGFVFGMAVALILKFSGVEKKLDAAVDQSVTITQDPRILEASEMITQGRAAEALSMLEKLYAEMPSSMDVQLEILRAAEALGHKERERAAYTRLMQLYLHEKQDEAVLNLFRELRGKSRLRELPAPVLMQIGQSLERSEQLVDATQAFEAVYQQNEETLLAVKAKIAHAKVDVRIGALEEARRLFTAARESPFSTKELDDAIDAEMAKLPSA